MSLPQERPKITRLRWVSAKEPETIEAYCRSLGARIQIYDILVKGNKFYMFFVPGDFSVDLQSGDLDN
jgi:hypothetical protein